MKSVYFFFLIMRVNGWYRYCKELGVTVTFNLPRKTSACRRRCVLIRILKCVNACMCVCLGVRLFVYMCLCCVPRYVCVYVCVCIYVRGCPSLSVHIFANVCLYVCAFIFVNIFTCMCAGVAVFFCICVSSFHIITMARHLIYFGRKLIMVPNQAEVLLIVKVIS